MADLFSYFIRKRILHPFAHIGQKWKTTAAVAPVRSHVLVEPSLTIGTVQKQPAFRLRNY
jgi:hypothetical protein